MRSLPWSFMPLKAGIASAGGRWSSGSCARCPSWASPGATLALGRLAAALEALLNAGVTVIEAWELAGAASGSPALRRAVLAWRPQVDGGRTPAESLRASPEFPELFANQYATGEISGQLDDTLRRLHGYYQEEGSRKLHALARWFPRAVYLVIVFLIAFFVVRSWSAYFRQIQNLSGF
jgi:type II secretory pathway component PulF